MTINPLSVITRTLVVSSCAISAVVVSPMDAIAGTNSGNFRDGSMAATAFCAAVSNRAWSYVGGLGASSRDPVVGDLERAALEIGSQLEAIYAKDAPADHRRAFRAGWENAIRQCVERGY